MIKQLKIKVIGQVQGVGFRSWTCKIARELNLVGFVKNMDDGSVEIIAEGDKRTLKKFLEALREGPPLAEVKDIFVEEKDLEETQFSTFEIRY